MIFSSLVPDINVALHVNVDLYHTTNRTATTNGPISLAGAASLGKCGYGNGIAVMERISGTVL